VVLLALFDGHDLQAAMETERRHLRVSLFRILHLHVLQMRADKKRRQKQTSNGVSGVVVIFVIGGSECEGTAAPKGVVVPDT
jgi:hypothetical protein